MSRDTNKEYIFEYLDMEEEITQLFPSFRKKRKGSKLALIKAISVAMLTFEEDSYIIPNEVLEGIGTRQSTVNKLLDEFPFFTYEPTWSYSKNEARIYHATKYYHLLYEMLVDNDKDIRASISVKDTLMDVTLWQVSPRTRKKMDKKYDLILHTVIDYDKLNTYLNTGRDDHSRDSITKIRKVVTQAKKRKGVMPQRYERKKTGRLFAMTDTSLQNIPKETKYHLYPNAWDYDMVNCHYYLLGNLIDNEWLDYYNENSTNIRNRLAEEYDLPVKKVKEFIIALAFGASTKTPFVEGDALYKIAGGNANRLIKDIMIEHLIVALNEATEHCLLTGKFDQYKGMRNSKNHLLTPRMMLAYYLQALESQIMDVITNNYKVESLSFDGFVSLEEYEPCELSAMVYKHTGFRVLFSREYIGYELDYEFMTSTEMLEEIEGDV